MPRLNHRKARTGCQRCKARKVKCDEGKPKCLACARHNVPCEYVDPQPRRSEGHQASPHCPGYGAVYPPSARQVAAIHNPVLAGELKLELRLMREWIVEICPILAADVTFWQKQATDLGLEHRIVLDAMFSLSALHLSWPLRGLAILDGANHNVSSRRDMLMVAQKYLQRALDGHGVAMNALNADNTKAVYATSVLLLYYSFFNLGEIAYEPTLPGYDHTFWTRLSGHTHYLCEHWAAMDHGEQLMAEWGVTFGRPPLPEAEELFSHEQGKPFTELLTFAEEYEANSTGNRAVYQQSVAYLAFVHRSIVQELDAPLINCQRLVAMPSQLGRQFTELIEQRAPRALLLLAHIFAMTKLLSDQVPWLRGIAERQVAPIQQQIPSAWQEMLRWPMETAFNPPNETTTDEQGNDQAIREMLQYNTDDKGQPVSQG